MPGRESAVGHEHTTSQRAFLVRFFQRKQTLPGRVPRRPQRRLGFMQAIGSARDGKVRRAGRAPKAGQGEVFERRKQEVPGTAVTAGVAGRRLVEGASRRPQGGLAGSCGQALAS
jgi:hypothetical protein